MNTKTISNLTFSILLSMCTASSVAQDYETWTEKMTCGEAQYKLVSICKPSHKEDELNECKQQTLEITNKGNVRKITLPELSKFSARVYKEVKGNIADLFVIQWGCGHDEKMSVLTLYYSVGGGSSPNSESFSTYNTNGKLIERENNQEYNKAMKDGFFHLKTVRSIMPD